MHNGCMATLTLKNVPDELYQRLKAQAAAHRRSLNQEAIELLGGAVPAEGRDAADEIRALKTFQESLGKTYSVTDEEIDRWKRAGRK